MRLKTLRKNRPLFEIEGAVVNGNRMDLSNNILKPTYHRSNTSFALPTSMNTEISYLHLSPSDHTHEMSTYSFQGADLLSTSQSSNMSSYKAIQTAYLEHGIRIRLSPQKTASATRPKSERKSTNSLRSSTACISRKSNDLHDVTANQDDDHDIESFSTLQQMSSNDFEQIYTDNASYNQSSPMNEEIPDDYYSASIIATENSNPNTPVEKLAFTNSTASTATFYDDDPDLVYMSSLLKIASTDSFRDTTRRQAVIRRTFSARPCSLTERPILTKQREPRERSAAGNRNSLARSRSVAATPLISSKKIESDILKHSSRIRSLSKDHSTKSPGPGTTCISNSPTRLATTSNNKRRNSSNSSLKPIGAQPLEHLLSPAPRSAILSADDLPSIKTVSFTRNLKSSVKHSKSATMSTDENRNTTNSVIEEHLSSPFIFNNETLSLIQTSPLDVALHSNLFDSDYLDPSSSRCDAQSLTSSTIVQLPSSILSEQLTHSATRRTLKKVSFYEEPKPVILTTTTTTYV